MITANGYSKDPNIVPEGIAVTFGKEMVAEKGGLRKFLRWFESCVSDENSYFMHKCKNRPTQDILYVYVIICNRVYYRCLYGGYSNGETVGFMHPDADRVSIVPWSRINLAGPIVKAPKKIVRKGFQGFRYTTKLF